LVITQAFEIAVGATGLMSGHPAQAAVDRLPFEATAPCLDLCDDVTSNEHGRAGALAQAVDGVENGNSTARSGIGDLGL
jgi:hypothetical protein